MIRRYHPCDCQEAARLFYQTVYAVNAADYTKAQLDAWVSGCADLGQWNQSLLAHYSLVAEEHGEIIGFGDIDPAGYLDRLYVHREHQGRGVASALCDLLEAAVPGSIMVHSSLTARPFFEKRGYQIQKKQQVERRGILLSNYVMKKIQ